MSPRLQFLTYEIYSHAYGVSTNTK